MDVHLEMTSCEEMEVDEVGSWDGHGESNEESEHPTYEAHTCVKTSFASSSSDSDR